MHADDQANRCGQFTGFSLTEITERLRQLRFQERGLDQLHAQVYAAGPIQMRMPMVKHTGSIVSFVRHSVFDVPSLATGKLPSMAAGKFVNPWKQLHVVLYPVEGQDNVYAVAAHYEADEILNIPGHVKMVIEGWLMHKTADYVVGTRFFVDLIRHDCGFHLLPKGNWLLAKWEELARGRTPA